MSSRLASAVFQITYEGHRKTGNAISFQMVIPQYQQLISLRKNRFIQEIALKRV